MASSTGSQHRRVFIGNIPYNAAEGQLIEICEIAGPVVSFRLVLDRETGKPGQLIEICEIAGPVVSFRLVLDRETGKPKGYGFCEYLDEETALSARRNLQGHWINGRQLRVDFAGNDRDPDRKRNRDGSQNLSSLQNDPVTQYLAKMSREQLTEIMSEMNALAVQNNAFAQQLLQGCPQLPQALLQAQIRLGMVPPQMMQMPSSSSGSVPNPALQTSEVSELMNHRSKRQKLEEHSSLNADGLRQHSEKQTSRFSPEVESALLEQVMSLTPEEISSLPVEEQQQVLQLQAQMQA